MLSGYLKKHPEVYHRMVAAYLIGYSVTPQYLAANPHLKFTESATDTGVMVSWNTEAAEVGGPNPVMKPGALAINPLNWTRDETTAPAQQNLGSIMTENGVLQRNEDGTLKIVKDYADARVDLDRGVVVCSTAPVDIPAPGNALFPRGVFHSFDYSFYYINIRSNAADRIAAFPCLPFPYAFTIANDAVTIDSFSELDRSGHLYIPAFIAGYPVTSINDSAFYGATNLNAITIPSTVTNIGSFAFSDCTSLTSVIFTGNVPSSAPPSAFSSTTATIFYFPGASGWDETFADRPAVCWNPTVSPATPPRFDSGQFGFPINGNANIPVRVEACDSLASPVWTTVADTAIPASASHPSRFYRLTFPQ